MFNRRHPNRMNAFLLAALPVAAALGGAARANVVGITVNDASSGDYTLTSLTVNRGPAGVFTYVPSQLIGVDLTDVAATGSTLLVPGGASVPAPGTRATLSEDWRLDTGVVNPFSAAAADHESFEFTFLSPVVNADGDDLVIFDIGSGDGTRIWINNDRANQSITVAAGDFSGTLLSGMPHTLYRFSGNVTNLTDLESPSGWTLDNTFTNGAVVALGIDLSDFGVAPGGTISSIRLQSTTSSARIDPVLVVGLPGIPEPASLTLLAATGAGLLLRRRASPR